MAKKFDTQNLPILKRLVLENFPTYKWNYLFAFIFMAIVALCTSLSAYIMRDLINGVFGERSMHLAYILGGTVLMIFTVKGLAAYFSAIMLSKIGNDIIAQKQKLIFSRILAQGLDFFAAHPTSELMTRVTHNANAVRDVLQVLITTVGRDMLSVIGLVGVMLVQDPALFMIAGLIMPIAVLGITSLRRRVKTIARNEFQSLTQLTGIVQESVQGIRIIKSFGLEEQRQAKMNASVEDVNQRANKIAKLLARTAPLMETLGGFAIAGVIIYGGYRVIHGGNDPGSFFSFITALLLAYDPAKRLARVQVQLEQGLMGARLMYELIDSPLTLPEREGAKPLLLTKAEVVFENISFAYAEKQIVQSLNLKADGGKVLALVGPSGMGKSTLLALLQRFYEVQGGRILIDGQDVREVTKASLMQAISFVSQDVFLFSGSVRENIAYGKANATQDEIELAAKAAHAHDFILALPQGYNTNLAEFGGGLSGGQRQRLAIARAILKNAPIMLLDEATSALDSESEQAILEGLDILLKGKTAIIVAHRLSTVQHAQKIAVIEEGKVSEEGTPAALLTKGGRYAQFVQLQATF
jgi:ATP-binding cassette, subfamily B, bacterial MsbA